MIGDAIAFLAGNPGRVLNDIAGHLALSAVAVLVAGVKAVRSVCRS